MPFIRKTKEAFVIQVNEIHNYFYNYDKSDYQGNHKKLIITCPLHGDFSMTPSNHIAGQDCPHCAVDKLHVKSLAKYSAIFQDTMLKVHGEKYNFSNSVFKGSHVKVEVVCPSHGPFWATPSNLQRARGCPDCQKNGFQPSKSGYFYIFTYGNITKVGITNTSINQRLQRINKSSGLDFNIHTFIFSESGYKIRDVEKTTLTWLKKHYQKVDTKFAGYTESFFDVDIENLINFVMPIIQEI